MTMRLPLFQRAIRAPHTISRSTRLTSYPLTSSYSSSATSHPNPQRAAQEDREKMDTQPNEYAKSGTDAAGAAQESAAFDPNSSNDPDEARKEAGKGNKVNPLDASPANPDLSSGTSEVLSGTGKKR